MPQQKFVEIALELAKRDWKVFPLSPNTKLASIREWQKQASSDPAKIKDWWKKASDSNIGLLTGRESGLAVVDVDVKNGKRGDLSWKSLGELPPTLMAATPTGGFHAYYNCPKEGLGCRVDMLEGIDLRADGGYVVAPGSLIDGKPYRWLDPSAEIIDLPWSVAEMIGNNKKNKKKNSFKLDGTITEGSRNEKLYKQLCSLRAQGWEDNAIYGAAKSLNETQCNPPLSDKEAQTCATQACKHKKGSGETAHDVSEDFIAKKFTEKHGDDCRYVNTWGSWFHWTGTYWEREETLLTSFLVRDVCFQIADECKNQKGTSRIKSSATFSSVEKILRADREHAAKPDQFDADDFLLNTPGGVIDLKSGINMPNEREHYMSKITSAFPENKSKIWLKFLDEITDGDKDLQSYLQRVMGYCLSGSTQEQALFFFYGTGSNGKSTFLNVIYKILGDYATKAPSEMFMESKTEQHPTSLAGLKGARVAIASEVSDGRRWNESRIKELTGGSPITARFMREDFFDFVPTFKIILEGNHKPMIKSVDEAIKRRMHLVPFKVTIPAEKREHGLEDKLIIEKNGILNWMLEGCLEWQKHGLKAPQAVVSATNDYLEAEDTFGKWIEETCEIKQGWKETSSNLYVSFAEWCKANGEYPRSGKMFSQALISRGYENIRTHNGKTFIGLKLLNSQKVGKNEDTNGTQKY